MGGKLFNLPRMPRSEYLAIEADVRRCLDARLADGYRIPRYYGDKPDFGDMDVVVAARPDWDAVRDEILRDLGITQVKPVGHVYSTLYRGLQTDFFTVPARYLESAYNFMSFNDLGNFIGRICRRFDLKYGDRGLSYVYRRASSHYKADLEVTRDLARICDFLGLDHAHWVAGFASLPEMFDWVIASPYFSVAPYLDAHERFGTLAQRAQERTTVARFVAYLRARGVTKRVDFDARPAYLPMVIAAFPDADLPAQIAREREREAREDALRAKFNGQLVMRLRPDLRGPALGEFIVRFKRSIDDFEAWVLAATDDDIATRIRAFAATDAP
jgi:hypothetical protein